MIGLFVLAIIAPVIAAGSPFLLNKDAGAFLAAYDEDEDGQVLLEECDDRHLFDEVETSTDGKRDGVATAGDIENWGAVQFPWFRDLFDQNIWQSGVDLFFNVALVLLLPGLLAWIFLKRRRRAVVTVYVIALVVGFLAILGPLRYSSAKRDYQGRVVSVRFQSVLADQRVRKYEARVPVSRAALREARAGEEAARGGSEQQISDAEAILLAAQGEAEKDERQLELWKQKQADVKERIAKPVHQYLAIMPPIAYHHADQDTERVTEKATFGGWGVNHVLGTDTLGRDVFARILYGTRVSLTIGVIATAIYCVIGTILGSIMGFFGGRSDMLLMRLVEIMMCFPRLPFILIVVGVFASRSIFLIMIAIGTVSWAGVARLIRGQFLAERGLDYVVAAKGLGIPTHRIIFKHVLPNAIHPMFVAATFGVAAAILIESGLAFLGLGDPNVPSWGQILLKGRETMSMWLILSPGFAIFLTVTALNLVGEGLRDALDPKLRQ